MIASNMGVGRANQGSKPTSLFDLEQSTIMLIVAPTDSATIDIVVLLARQMVGFVCVLCLINKSLLSAAKGRLAKVIPRWLSLELKRELSTGPVYLHCVSVLTQVIVLPVLVGSSVYAMHHSPSPFVVWWFNSPLETKNTFVYSYMGAYFAGDSIIHSDTLQPLFLVHHLVCFLCCFAAELSSQCGGLTLTMALVLEVGSLAYNILCWSEAWYPSSRMFLVRVSLMTSVVPLMWVLIALLWELPSSLSQWFVVVCVLGLGLMRTAFFLNLDKALR
jgi:hypothetical protein